MKWKMLSGLYLCAALSLAQNYAGTERDRLLAAGLDAYANGRYAEAEHAYREALRLAEAGPQDNRLARLLAELGALNSAMNRCEDGLRFGSRAVRLYETLGTSDSGETTYAWQNLASSYFCLGLFSQTEHALLKCLALAESDGPQPKSKIAEILASLAAVYTSRQNDVAAMAAATRANATLQGAPETDSRTKAVILNNLGSIYLKLGRFDEAESTLLEALSAAEAIPRNGELTRLSVLINTAFNALNQKRYSEAAMRFSRTVELIDQGTALLDSEVERTLRGYTIALEKSGHKDMARRISSRAKAWRRDHPAPDPAQWTIGLRELGSKN